MRMITTRIQIRLINRHTPFPDVLPKAVVNSTTRASGLLGEGIEWDITGPASLLTRPVACHMLLLRCSQTGKGTLLAAFRL